MALKELSENLENFKYGLTSPDKVDSQIQDGVDFFDDNTGGAVGFTPSVDLESRYKKFTEGTVVSKGGDVDYYADLNPITPRSSTFVITPNNTFIVVPKSGNVFNQPLTSLNPTQHTSTGPTQFTAKTFDDTHRHPAAHGSNFMDTPIAGYISQFDDASFSTPQTHGTEGNQIRGDKRFNNRTYYISNQPAGNSFSSPSTPNAHRIAVANPNPIENLVSGMDDMVYGGYNLPGSLSSAGSSQIQIINDKRRGVFDHLTLTSFEHQQFPENQSPNSVFAPTYIRYFSETNGKSIHISDAGQLKAGVRYGASVGGAFTNFINGANLTDVKSAVGGDVTQFATLTPIADRTSQFSTNETPFEDSNSNTPTGFGNQQQTLFLKKEEWSKTNQINNWRETSNTLIDTFSDGEAYGGIEWKDGSPTIAGLITQNKNYKDNSVKIGGNDIFDFSTKGSNTFSNVPSGISENGIQGTKDYRGVANSGPFSGNNNHPLILRDIGNRWGFDNPPGFLDTLDQVAGGFVRGAPGLAGLIDRSLTDKVRLGKLIFTTNIGLQFITKQFALQALNPTLESKIWNPASALSITGVGDLISGLIDGARGGKFPTPDDILGAAASAAISAAIPIGHPERHLGGGRYENVINATTKDLAGKVMGRIRLSAEPFGVDVESSSKNKLPKSKTGFGFVDDFINEKVDAVNDGLAGALIVPFFALSNPNKYAFPISSAPKSVKDGKVSFVGSVDLALSDTIKALNTPGGTFNKATSNSDIESDRNDQLSKNVNHSTLAYKHMGRDNQNYYDSLKSASEFNRALDGGDDNNISKSNEQQRITGRDILVKSGDSAAVGGRGTIDDIISIGKNRSGGAALGVVKGTTRSPNVDRINIIPAIKGETNKDGTAKLPDIIKNNPDFIKFMFKDVTNNKYLVFRAILDGISDSVTPNFSDTQYIGRPDKLYTYTGTDRSISFNFKVYPKTKQELPVLMEKLNYLVGMCYPSFTEGQRMITPFMELTLGDMFNGTPGLLETLSLTVEDATTWEIDEGLQYPHFISAACTFKHIGKYVPTANGKHYDLPWLDIGNRQTEELPGFEPTPADSDKVRVRTKFNYIDTIGATVVESL